MDPTSSPAAGGVKVSQADRIYWELRSSIVLAELRPGTVMVEGALAETFGASKTPVREALRQLQHDGVVTVLPRKGYVVSAFGLDDLLDVYALRGLLQPPLAAAAAAKRGQRHLDELEAVAKRDRDARTYLQSLMAGAEFQIIVAQASGSRRAAKVVRDLIFEAFRFWMLLQPPAGRLQEALAFQQERYQETYAALESGDAPGASRIMAELIEASRQEMTARMLASATLG
jgi:DNA-binding GntR family transcriptional regulator